MRIDDAHRRAEARASAYNLDLLTKAPSKFAPTAPWIIPAMMILVVLFAFICIATRIIINYLRKKKNLPNIYGFSDDKSSPELVGVSADGKRTTAPSGHSTRSSRKTRPLRLDQITPQRNAQLKSLIDTSSNKSKKKSPSTKAMGRVAKHTANRSLNDNDKRNDKDDNSDDITHDDGDNSPTNISRHSDDTDEINMRQDVTNQADFVYKTAYEPNLASANESGYPQQERHIVRMSSIEDYHQSATIRPTTESDI